MIAPMPETMPLIQFKGAERVVIHIPPRKIITPAVNSINAFLLSKRPHQIAQETRSRPRRISGMGFSSVHLPVEPIYADGRFHGYSIFPNLKRRALITEPPRDLSFSETSIGIEKPVYLLPCRVSGNECRSTEGLAIDAEDRTLGAGPDLYFLAGLYRLDGGLPDTASFRNRSAADT
jgi:hypothetical protein